MASKKEVTPLGEGMDLEIVIDDVLDSSIEPFEALTPLEITSVDTEAKTPREGKTAKPTTYSATYAADPGIEDLIIGVDDSVEYLTWVIYGKNGTGKTTLLSTVDNVLILAAEDGTLSLRGKAKNARKILVDTWDKLESIYWLLRNGNYVADGGIEIKARGGSFVVKYLAIDTITKLSEVCMRNVVLGDKESDKSRDLIKRTLRDWGDMTDKMKYWLQQFEELPLQRVYLFQETANSEDVDSEEFSIFPAVSKSLRTYVMSEADIIARTYISRGETGVQYRLSAAPNPMYVTKDRTSVINKGAIISPNLTKIHNAIFK